MAAIELIKTLYSPLWGAGQLVTGDTHEQVEKTRDAARRRPCVVIQ